MFGSTIRQETANVDILSVGPCCGYRPIVGYILWWNVLIPAQRHLLNLQNDVICAIIFSVK